MARINGVEPHEASLFTRFVYWLARRKIGKIAGKNQIVEPLKIAAHHLRLFRGYGQMEMAQHKLKSVDPVLVVLAEIKVAAMIGCPF